ncbi:MAG: hypothetical protein RLZZ225_1118 [Pseudomonadota bacterium]|jgi:hypothetical protein
MDNPKAQAPTVVDTPVVINENLSLNINIVATISYKQVSPPKP